MESRNYYRLKLVEDGLAGARGYEIVAHLVDDVVDYVDVNSGDVACHCGTDDQPIQRNS